MGRLVVRLERPTKGERNSEMSLDLYSLFHIQLKANEIVRETSDNWNVTNGIVLFGLLLPETFQ